MPQFHCCMYLLHCRLLAKTVARKQHFRSNLSTKKLVWTFLHEDGKQTKEGWTITPCTHPLIVNMYLASHFILAIIIMFSVTSYYALSVNLYPHQISKKDVDNFKPGKNIPPKCVLLVEWDLEDQKPVRLRYKINFIGAKPNLFNLSLNPTWKGNIPLSCGFIALQCLCFLPFILC